MEPLDDILSSRGPAIRTPMRIASLFHFLASSSSPLERSLKRPLSSQSALAPFLPELYPSTESSLYKLIPSRPSSASFVQSLLSSTSSVPTTITTTTDISLITAPEFIESSSTALYYPELLSEDFHESIPSTTSSAIYLKILIGIFLFLVILISIFGNLLVCVAIYSDRKLRRLGNIFIVSLAIADLCVGALVMTFALANDLLDYWPFGPQLCEIWIAFDISCSTCSIINLCAIALDRFIHIKDPMRYNRWVSKRIVVGSVSLIWLVSCLISFVPISLGWHRPTDNPLHNPSTAPLSHNPRRSASIDNSPNISNPMSNDIPSTSLIDFDSIQASILEQQSVQFEYDDSSRFQCALDLTPTYAVVSSIISFYLPCIVMLCLYAKLYAICQQHVRSIKSMTKPSFSAVPSAAMLNNNNNNNNTINSNNHKNSFQSGPNQQMMVTQQKSNEYSKNVPKITTTTTTTTTTTASSVNFHHHRSQQQQKQVTDHKAAITLGIIMGTFLACWMPFFCMNIVAAFCKTCIPGLVFKILTWLGYFNSSLNPAIYSIFNTEFRDAFRRILVRYLFNGDLNSGSGMCSMLVMCRGGGATIDSPDHLSYSGGGGGAHHQQLHNQQARNSGQSFNFQPQFGGGNSRQSSCLGDRPFGFEPSVAGSDNSVNLLNEPSTEQQTEVFKPNDKPTPTPSTNDIETNEVESTTLLFADSPSSSSSSSSVSLLQKQQSSAPPPQNCPKQSSNTQPTPQMVAPSSGAPVRLPPPQSSSSSFPQLQEVRQIKQSKMFARPPHHFYQNHTSQSFDESRVMPPSSPSWAPRSGSTTNKNAQKYQTVLCKRPFNNQMITHSSTNGINGITPSSPLFAKATPPFTTKTKITSPQIVIVQHNSNNNNNNNQMIKPIQTFNPVHNDNSNAKVWEI